MEPVGKLLNKAEREKSLVTTPQPSQRSWAGLLWTLAQSRSKQMTTAEVALWKAKLSGYPSALVEWALVSYNGEFFPNPSTICRMIEVKRESMAAEHDSREWNAWKANKAQAEAEGKLASDADYERLKALCREILAKAPSITAAGRPRKHGESGPNVQIPNASQPGEDRAESQANAGAGIAEQDNLQQPTNQANV